MRFISFLQSSLNHTVKHYSGYFTTLIASLVVLFGGALATTLISLLSHKFFTAINIDLQSYVLLQGAYAITGVIIMFVVITFLSGLVVLSSLNTNGTRNNARALADQFISYLFLNVLMVIVAFIATSPLIGISLLQYTFHDTYNIISTLLLISTLVLQVVVVIFFATTPFLMLDKKLHLKETLQKNLKNVSARFSLLAQRAVGLFLFLFIINFGLAVSEKTPLETLWALTIPLFFAPFLVSYLALTYKEISN